MSSNINNEVELPKNQTSLYQLNYN